MDLFITPIECQLSNQKDLILSKKKPQDLVIAIEEELFMVQTSKDMYGTMARD